MLFVQTWGGATPQAAASTLAGYYCAAPGEQLTPGAAETVVRSIGLLPPRAGDPRPSGSIMEGKAP